VSSSLRMIMTSVVAVLVVAVGNMDMACIVVLDALLRGCIEVVLEHRCCIAVVGTGADAGVVDAGGVAGAEVDVVAVQ
jgi:hypothetical protein